MTAYTIAEDLTIFDANDGSCWQCRQPLSLRTYSIRSGVTAWQACCPCGSRGLIHRSREEAMESYKCGNVRFIGEARAQAFAGELQDDWLSKWKFYLSPQEKESIVSEVFSAVDGYGFVYVMADLANHEVKIGGTGRMPADRWKEHPRGLIPIMAIATRDWKSTESLAHTQLASRRTSREEYFKATIPLAVQAVISAAMFDDSAFFEVGFGDHFDSLEVP